MQGTKSLGELAEVPRVSRATKAASEAAHFARPNALGVVQAILLNLQRAMPAPKKCLPMMSKAQICARASPKPTAIATWRLMKLLALASLGITGAQHGTMHCHGKPLEMTMRWLRAWIG